MMTISTHTYPRGMMKTLTTRAVGAALVALSAFALSPALGASLDAQVRMTVPPQSQPIAITGATIHTVTSGTFENGTIVFENGLITAVGGADVQIPAGAQVVDATGKHIYPGMIDAYTTVGISEIGAVDVSNDTNEMGDFNPNIRAAVAVNGESRHIGTTRSAGVLTAITTPGGGLISGMSSAMALEGWDWEEMTMEASAALNVNWPNPNPRFRGFGGGRPGGGGGGNGQAPPTYEEQVQSLKGFFANARGYRDAVQAGEVLPTDSRYAAMIPVLDREIPVVVAANSTTQINDAITWATEENVRIVIRGGDDAIYVADRLVANNIPVILTTTMAGPGRDWEGYDGSYHRAAALHEAGVRFAISGGSSALYSNRLGYEAGVAVAFGLPEEVALEAVTINAAEFLGLDDRIGSLEPGKQATLMITTGSPLDTKANIEQAYIQGRELDMMDIQKWFFEKYMVKVMQMRRLIM